MRLAFNEDDAANVVGGYIEDGGNLTIEVGPMPKAACPPESCSDQAVTPLARHAAGPSRPSDERWGRLRT
jgi:hypothetical protein